MTRCPAARIDSHFLFHVAGNNWAHSTAYIESPVGVLDRYESYNLGVRTIPMLYPVCITTLI
jgi:hypothetical protein